MEIKRKLKPAVFFAWYDFWVGVYFDRKAQALYVCLLPMLVIKLQYEDVAVCHCGGKMGKVALDTGDGWVLFWECPNDCEWSWRQEFPIEWPFGDRLLSDADMLAEGYETV